MKTKRTSKLLETLKDEAREVINDLLELGYKNNMNVQAHSAYRSPAEQDKLFAQGRSAPGKIITNARGTPVPQSSHCYRVAVDLHFDLDKDGVAEWDMSLYEKLWNLAVEAGLDKKGLRWAGNWKSFKEGPHFEVTFGKGWKDLAHEAGYKVEGYVPSKSARNVEVKPAEEAETVAKKPAPKKAEEKKPEPEKPKKTTRKRKSPRKGDKKIAEDILKLSK